MDTLQAQYCWAMRLVVVSIHLVYMSSHSSNGESLYYIACDDEDERVRAFRCCPCLQKHSLVTGRCVCVVSGHGRSEQATICVCTYGCMYVLYYGCIYMYVCMYVCITLIVLSLLNAALPFPCCKYDYCVVGVLGSS
jgi:hypothetical protein